jgi:hypothetical protein
LCDLVNIYACNLVPLVRDQTVVKKRLLRPKAGLVWLLAYAWPLRHSYSAIFPLVLTIFNAHAFLCFSPKYSQPVYEPDHGQVSLVHGPFQAISLAPVPYT